MCLLYGVNLRVGCVEYYTATEGCVCVFYWKTTDLVCLNRLNAALDEWHSETGLKWRSIGMKRLTKIMTATMFACSIPTFAAAASFNCAKASTANEIAICSDDELSTLDEALAAIYKQARSSVSDAKRLKTEQVNWIKSLGTCNGNVDCLISAYDTRILILDYLDGTIAVKSYSLQDRISQLNEQEEILVLRENALTTELRALNSEIERFEEEKLAFAKLKDAPIVAEELSSQIPQSEGQNKTPPNYPLKFREVADVFNEKWSLMKRLVPVLSSDGKIFANCKAYQVTSIASSLLTEDSVDLALETTYWIALGAVASDAVHRVEVSQGEFKGINLERFNSQTATCSVDNSTMLSCSNDCRAKIIEISK